MAKQRFQIDDEVMVSMKQETKTTMYVGIVMGFTKIGLVKVKSKNTGRVKCHASRNVVNMRFHIFENK